ncbi:glycoside hydrolase family 18 protein [Daldinia vernicosa]|uniref:glycoside hydrolase family 18 protein n=1 Tax=Daldinia vernicosa TaxID=114800 RepID=UPI0020086E1A|nr:glycoside hydrolase family 18 protein [Daldinia vernicosa]KAI0845219.1 glycoside hydrolase family 18 protein [Daldinia vernicosa]
MLPRLLLATSFLWVSKALAGFQAGTSDNIAIYWGQNSAGVSDAGKSQLSLSEYCKNAEIDIIPVAFLANLNPIQVDLTNMIDSNMAEEITTCQKAGKTILLSIGGATFTSAPSSPQDAQSLADQIWGMFGPPGNGNGVNRPFGDAVVDGFDLDIEAPLQNMAPFAARLRENIDKANAAGNRKFYLSAAPQCPFPDMNNLALMQGDAAVAFDFVMVQFYNNPKCDIRVFTGAPGSGSGSVSARDTNDPTKTGFNMAVWDEWARTSKNPNTKIFLGIPGGPTAVSPSEKASYKAPQALGPIIAYSKQFSSFGGVMIWDMSQVWANPNFLDTVSKELKCPPKGNAARRSTSAAAHAHALRRAHQREWRA